MIYLDYAATTPVAPEVAESMAACLTAEGTFGNPASRSHTPGWLAEQAVERARSHLANYLGCDPREVVWTSGATEANNLAIKGVAEQYQLDHGAPGHMVTTEVEHKAVLEVMDWLVQQGWTVTRLRALPGGAVDVQDLLAALRPDTALVSCMWVNNEIGVINPIAEIAEVLSQKGAVLHVDAAQALGKVPLHWGSVGPDLMSLSAHKCYGPKGAGVLVKRRSCRIKSQIQGGDQEQKLRGGTLATHQVVGFGAAVHLLESRYAADLAHVRACREAFLKTLLQDERIQENGGGTRVPHITNLYFAGADSEALMAALPDLAFSSGSACNSASVAPSHVLRALGLPAQRALASLRFSFGRDLSVQQAADAAQLLLQSYRRLVPA